MPKPSEEINSLVELESQIEIEATEDARAFERPDSWEECTLKAPVKTFGKPFGFVRVQREEIPPQVVADLTPDQRRELFETLANGKGVFVHISAIRGLASATQPPKELEVVRIGYDAARKSIKVTAANTVGLRDRWVSPEGMPPIQEIRVTWAGGPGPVLSRGEEEPIILIDRDLPVAPPGTPFVVTEKERRTTRRSRRGVPNEVVIAKGYYLNPDKRLVLLDSPRAMIPRKVVPQHPAWGNFVRYNDVWRRYDRLERGNKPVSDAWIPDAWLECQTPLEDARGRNERLLLVKEKFTEPVRRLITYDTVRLRLWGLPWQEAFSDAWRKYKYGDKKPADDDLKAKAHERFREKLFSWQERQNLLPYDEQNPDELTKVLQHLFFNLLTKVPPTTESIPGQAINIWPYINSLLRRYAQTIVDAFPTVGSLAKLTTPKAIEILAKCVELSDFEQKEPEGHWAVKTVAPLPSPSYRDVCINVFGFSELETDAWFWAESNAAETLAAEVNDYYSKYREAIPTGYTTKDRIYELYVKLGRRPTLEDFIDRELEEKYYPKEVTIPGLGEVSVKGYETFKDYTGTGKIETLMMLDLSDKEIVRMEGMPEQLGTARYIKPSRFWLEHVDSSTLPRLQERIRKTFFQKKLSQLLRGEPEMWAELYTNSPEFFELLANSVASSSEILDILTKDELAESDKKLLHEMAQALKGTKDFEVASLDQIPQLDVLLFKHPDFGEVRIAPKYVFLTPTGVRFLGVKGAWELHSGDRYSWRLVHEIFESRLGNVPEAQCRTKGCDKPMHAVTEDGYVYLECSEHPVINPKKVLRFKPKGLYANTVLFPGVDRGYVLSSVGCAVYDHSRAWNLTYDPKDTLGPNRITQLNEMELFLYQIGRIKPGDTMGSNGLLMGLYKGREVLEEAVKDTLE